MIMLIVMIDKIDKIDEIDEIDKKTNSQHCPITTSYRK